MIIKCQFAECDTALVLKVNIILFMVLKYVYVHASTTNFHIKDIKNVASVIGGI